MRCRWPASGRRIGIFLCLILVYWPSPAKSFSMPLGYAQTTKGATSNAIPVSCKYTYQTQEILTPDGFIQVELYQPVGPKHTNLILVLHGAQGALTRKNAAPPSRDNLGEIFFARHCFVVAFPHYFDPLGIKSSLDTSFLRRHFWTIEEYLQQVLNDESNLPEVRGRPVGLIGDSYGGFLALALAEESRRVMVVSTYGSGWPRGLPLPVRKNLKCLFFHGDMDGVVPLSSAEALERRIVSGGGNARLTIFHNTNHILSLSALRRFLEQSITQFETMK